jgi:ribosomal protein S12 methylthiotransferase
VAALADELMDQRAAERVGEVHEVLIEEPVANGGDEEGQADGSCYLGRGAHQAPEVDGTTTVRAGSRLAAGDMVMVRVTGAEGVDLMAEQIGRPAGGGHDLPESAG